MSEENKVTPMASPKEDLKRISKNSEAVVGELREFLSTLKGKSPKEMMGSVADSSLFMSLLLSTAIMVVLLFALTAIPYAAMQFEDESSDEKEAAEQESETAPVESSSPSQTANPTPQAPKTKEEATADALGIGDQKTAAPDSNPLDSSSDDLLKGLDDI